MEAWARADGGDVARWSAACSGLARVGGSDALRALRAQLVAPRVPDPGFVARVLACAIASGSPVATLRRDHAYRFLPQTLSNRRDGVFDVW